MAQAAHETFFFDDEESGLGAAQETQRALIDTQERMGMMLDVMPMGLLIHTEQGILFANREACGMLQISQPQAVGHHFLDFVDPKEFEAVRRQFVESFEHPSSMHKQESTIARADGSRISIKLLSGRLPWQGTPVLQVLLQDVTDLKLKEQRLRLLTITDDLTGAYNRRHLFDTAALLFDQLRDDPRLEISVVSLDIDHFKKINDTYGHAVGDLALRRLSAVAGQTISEAGRKDSLFARIGGEEFLVLLPGTASREAATIAESLRIAIAEIVVETSACEFRFTASMGVATYQPGDGFDALLSRGDRALYEAKHTGRNRIVVV